MTRPKAENEIATREDQETEQAAPSTELASMPSPHINHANVFQNELVTRMQGFKQGIEALTAELEGQQMAHEEAVAALAREHNSSKKALLERIGILQTGERMAAAGLDAFEQGPPAAEDGT